MWEYSTYQIPTVTEGLKDYYISKKDFNYNEGFGTKDVISPRGTGKERFYIMALTDIDEKTYTWYQAAYSNEISDYSSITKTEFGTGKTNTTTMISKWNEKAYGEQDQGSSEDMWGKIQTKVNDGWFVPSKEEWTAFAGELRITSRNYGTFGLSSYNWSSSLNNTNLAWCASFKYYGCSMYAPNINGCDSVRLSTTF